MKKLHVDHILRAAGRITGEREFIIIGSQSLHATCPDVPDQIDLSAELDLVARNRAARTEWLDAIGVHSRFHESFGYYADPVDESSAILPKDWQSRLVPLPPGDTEGVLGLCLDPHDLAIAKYVARHEKDLRFTRELARRRIVERPRLLALLEETPVPETVRDRIRADIECDFDAPR